MAQGSRQVQTQAQQQIQTLSPQQILVVKLLELPAVELEDRVRAELLENPALEEGKEDTPGDEYSDMPDTETGSEDGEDTSYDSLSDYLNEDDIPDYKLQENNRSKGEQAEEIPFSDTTSFYETLRQQLGEQDLPPHQRELAEYLIGSLDDDGLLRRHRRFSRRTGRSIEDYTRLRPRRSGCPHPARVPAPPDSTQGGPAAHAFASTILYGRRYSYPVLRRVHPQALGQDYAKIRYQRRDSATSR